MTQPQSQPWTGTANVTDLKIIIESNRGVCIDVREPDEYLYEHIDGTLNAPLSVFDQKMVSLPKDKDLFVFCETGIRTVTAVDHLKTAGFNRVHAVEGGVQAWKMAGYALVKSGGVIPVMRQVQIVAGSLALVGGLFPNLRWIAIVIGAGLLFAGVSGWCGMAKVLAKMPWNKTNPKLGCDDAC